MDEVVEGMGRFGSVQGSSYVTFGVPVRLKEKASTSDSGLRAEGLVMDEAELPRLCRRP